MARHRDAVGDNEAFVGLVLEACRERDFRVQLEAILRQNSFNRQSLLNTMIGDARMQGADADFVDALAALTDDAVAARVLDLLTQELEA